jgi:hypothetical protein
MTKSEFSKKLDLIQVDAQKKLSQFGYRKKGRTFNRSLESGLIHVINFQMGRRSLSGKFTINLGIYIPEIYRLLWFWNEDEPKFVDHGDCEIEKRIGELVPPYKDNWWDLNKNTKRLSKKVLTVIEKYGLPYLNLFYSHDDIIQEWNKHGDNIGLPPRAGLSIAILLHNKGDHEQARNLLIQEYNRKLDHPYAGFVVDIAQKLGISLVND